ncbi:glandular kallikrein-like [Sitophilus oryzae]|uniref:Glandular kallikrein-like n=1 Tax=Sitophilus oryzae TaxID=7048 RepID=A0A6J2YIU8_SITOR|nr:glandular kallikrein-like [Sitophilus oryzae]
MKCLSLALVILSVCSAALAVSNGTIQEAHSTPWNVIVYPAIDLYDYIQCVGVLISRNYVLTAAQCLHTTNQYVKIHSLGVYAGVYNWYMLEDFVQSYGIIPINKVYEHEGYNATTYENDIAIIELPHPVNITDEVQIAELATEEEALLGEVGYIAGWSFPVREENHGLPHGGNVTVVSNSVCQETYPSYKIDEKVICTSGPVAVCNGDQGTGLTVNGKVVGIAYAPKSVLSPTEECPIVPNTYLYIPKYLDWIKAHSDYE